MACYTTQIPNVRCIIYIGYIRYGVCDYGLWHNNVSPINVDLNLQSLSVAKGI